ASAALRGGVSLSAHALDPHVNVVEVARYGPEDLHAERVPATPDEVVGVVAGREAGDAQRLRDRVGQLLAVVGAEVNRVGVGVRLVVVGAGVGDRERVVGRPLARRDRHAVLLGDGDDLVLDDVTAAAIVRVAGR